MVKKTNNWLKVLAAVLVSAGVCVGGAVEAQASDSATERLVGRLETLVAARLNAEAEVRRLAKVLRQELTVEAFNLLSRGEQQRLISILGRAPDVSEQELGEVLAVADLVVESCAKSGWGTPCPAKLGEIRVEFSLAHERWSRITEQSSGVSKKLRRHGIGESRTRVFAAVGNAQLVALAPQRLESACASGIPLDALGRITGLHVLMGQEGSGGARPQKSGDKAGDDESMFAATVTPDDAIIIMLLEYEGRWDRQAKEVRRYCSRVRFLREAPVTSIEVTSFGYGDEGQNRVDLLTQELREKLSSTLETKRHFIVPIEKLLRYKVSRGAAEVLRDGQDIEIAVRRAISDDERETMGGPEEHKPFVLSWNVRAEDMPRWFVSTQALVGLYPTREAHGGEPFFSVGPAGVLTYRAQGGEEYLGIGVLLYVGTASQQLDPEALKGLRAIVFGTGLQLDMSGYLGVGAGVVADGGVDTAMGVVYLNPFSRLLQAAGLEWGLD